MHSVETFEIRIVILQSVLEWQHDKRDWSAKTPIFRLNWLPCLARESEKPNEVNKPFHPFTNSEILLKIFPLAFEKQVLENRPLKI